MFDCGHISITEYKVGGFRGVLQGFGYVKVYSFYKVEFAKCICDRANNGRQISFWNDLWCGNSSLKDQSLLIISNSLGSQFHGFLIL